LNSRLSLAETWDLLDEDETGEPMLRDKDGSPLLPARAPRAGKPGFGSVEVYKSGWDGADMRNLTVPRSFFARSLLERVSFQNTDLSESWFCWNDFDGCDFSGARLAQSDMRCSYWKNCCFDGADLTHTDLRGSTFENCTFVGANLALAKILPGDDLLAVLSEQQQAGLIQKQQGSKPYDGCILG
jgi:BTB/POZ domain-containing protein KCTD9